MKKKLLAILLCNFILCGQILAQETIWVPGHVKKDGTWVEGYYKTKPNKTKKDNYSSDGNYNPYTGKEGKKKNESNEYYNEQPKKRKKSTY